MSSATGLVGAFQPAHAAVRTRDPEAARAGLTSLFSAHELVLTGCGAGFHARADAATLGRVRLVHLALGAEVGVRPAPLNDYYAINIVLRGGLTARHGRAEVVAHGDVAGILLRPDVPASMRWSADCELLSVRVDDSVVDEQFIAHWERAPGPSDLAFGLTTRCQAVKNWLELVRWVARDLSCPDGLTASALARARIGELLVTGLVAAQQAGPEPAVERPVSAGPIRRAVEYIDAYPERPLTVVEIAEIAGVGVRTLQAGFRKHLGMSPTAYLRSVRLDRVHECLTAPEASDETVTDVALRWGFGHLPRFAAAYRQRFGTSPSDTLARGRRQLPRR
jgi:AraC-like DNA-binding protein